MVELWAAETELYFPAMQSVQAVVESLRGVCVESYFPASQALPLNDINFVDESKK